MPDPAAAPSDRTHPVQRVRRLDTVSELQLQQLAELLLAPE